MEQVILFLSLLHLHLKLSVLLLLFDADQFSEDVLEELLVSDAFLAVVDDLIEHILESHHIVRAFLEGEVHDLQHNNDKMLYLDFLIWHFLKLLFYDLQLAVEHQSTDLRGGVFRQVLDISLLQEFFNKAYHDLNPFFALNEVAKGVSLLFSFLLLLQSKLLQFFLLETLHLIKLYGSTR